MLLRLVAELTMDRAEAPLALKLEHLNINTEVTNILCNC